jgi:hypothetical protein
MPKALCLVGMVVSILLAILFLFDLVAPASVSPFRGTSWLMDISFLICSILLGIMSWLTFREQV